VCSRPRRPIGFPIYAVPRRSLGEGGSLASPRLHCISAAPAALNRYPLGVAGHVALPFAPLYLGSSRCARPLPSRRSRPCRSSRSLHSFAAFLTTLSCTIDFFSKSSVAPAFVKTTARRTATLLQRERRRQACHYRSLRLTQPPQQSARLVHRKRLMIGKFPADARSPEDESCSVLYRTCK